jgi:hypothetical protein
MKRLPILLASLFVVLSIWRVGTFIQDVLNGLFLSWVFAIALAASVFCAGYYFKYSETRVSAIVALVIFLPSDLMLNLFEVVRVTSAATLVKANANFLNVSAEDLRNWMQIGGILFGVLQTLAAAVLGWMSAGSDRIKFGTVKALLPRIGRQIDRFIDGLFPARDTEGAIYASDAERQESRRNHGKEYRRTELNAADKNFISTADTRQIQARFNIAPRTARDWKQDARDGKL